jgi:hypothetical protein
LEADRIGLELLASTRFEDADANFFIPRTSIPADFAMLFQQRQTARYPRDTVQQI